MPDLPTRPDPSMIPPHRQYASVFQTKNSKTIPNREGRKRKLDIGARHSLERMRKAETTALGAIEPPGTLLAPRHYSYRMPTIIKPRKPARNRSKRTNCSIRSTKQSLPRPGSCLLNSPNQKSSGTQSRQACAIKRSPSRLAIYPCMQASNSACITHD